MSVHIERVHEDLVNHKKHIYYEHGETSAGITVVAHCVKRGSLDMPIHELAESFLGGDVDAAARVCVRAATMELDDIKEFADDVSTMPLDKFKGQFAEATATTGALLWYRQKHGEPQPDDRIQEIWFGIDGHALDTSLLDEGDEHPDDFEEDFNTNPFTKVKRCVTTFILRDDKMRGVEFTGMWQTYSVDDGNVLVFGEPHLVDEKRVTRETFDKVELPPLVGPCADELLKEIDRRDG